MENLNEAVSLLWQRANDHLTLEELEDLSSAGDDALLIARNLATTCANLVALIADDKNGGWIKRAEDVSALLYGIQNQVETIHALSSLGALVDDKINDLLGWDLQARIKARERRTHS